MFLYGQNGDLQFMLAMLICNEWNLILTILDNVLSFVRAENIPQSIACVGELSLC